MKNEQISPKWKWTLQKSTKATVKIVNNKELFG